VTHGHPSNSLASCKFTITNTLLCASFVVSMSLHLRCADRRQMLWFFSPSIDASWTERQPMRLSVSHVPFADRPTQHVVSSDAVSSFKYNVQNNYIVSQKKTFDYIFYNNYKCQITVIFGILSSQTMRHRKMVSFPTSTIYCNCLTLGNHRTQKWQI